MNRKFLKRIIRELKKKGLKNHYKTHRYGGCYIDGDGEEHCYADNIMSIWDHYQEFVIEWDPTQKRTFKIKAIHSFEQRNLLRKKEKIEKEQKKLNMIISANRIKDMLKDPSCSTNHSFLEEKLKEIEKLYALPPLKFIPS